MGYYENKTEFIIALVEGALILYGGVKLIDRLADFISGEKDKA